jgi:hypothetical protein
MNIPNYGLLDPKPSEPAGYVTKDEMWAAVPFGKKFMILHNGEQIHVCQNLSSAKSYINKQIKVSKIVPGTSSLEAFL